MKTETFTLTEQHIKLLRKADIYWNMDEFGAPGINPKRPYGNSDVIGDIAEILGVTIDPDFGPDGATEKRLTTLHRETGTALQIVLDTGTFEPGRYEREQYGLTPWKRVE